MFRLWVALQFLTRIPLRLTRPPTEEEMAGALLWFPAVGLLLGVLGAGSLLLLERVASHASLLAGFVVVLLWVVLTGAFHLDGLADTFDGLLSGRSGAEAGQIMKDSRLGAMGAVALFLVLSAKIIALGEVAQRGLWWAALLAPATGRWWIVLAAWRGRSPPWCHSGIGYLFAGKVTLWRVLASGAMILGAGGLALWFAGGTLTALGLAGAALLAGCLASLALTLRAYRTLGGITGDVLGAGCEIAEATVLVVVALL